MEPRDCLLSAEELASNGYDRVPAGEGEVDGPASELNDDAGFGFLPAGFVRFPARREGAGEAEGFERVGKKGKKRKGGAGGAAGAAGGGQRMVAIDCEMCQTEEGKELTRVSVRATRPGRAARARGCVAVCSSPEGEAGSLEV